MKKWEKIANDYHCNFWKNYLFVKAATIQPDLVDMPQVYLAVRGYPKTIDYLYIPETWRMGHEKLAQLADRDSSLVYKILEKTKSNGEKMNNYTRRFVHDDLTRYSDRQLIAAYKKHAELNCLEYAWGVMIPILDFHNVHYIEDKLKGILAKNLNESEINQAFAVFTQPIEDSFALEQEKEILRIFQVCPRRFLKESPETVLQKLEDTYPNIYRRLRKHAKKFAWITYVYSGPAATEKNFVEILRFYARKKINPVKKLKHLAEERKKILREREKYFQKMKLSAEEKKLVNLAAEIMHFKPRRKDYQSISYWHLEFLQREIGWRTHLSLAQVRSCTLPEIEKILQGKKVDIHTINERIKFHIVVPSRRNIKVFAGDEARKYKKNIKSEKSIVKKDGKIQGQSAFPGKAKGVVRRIDMPEDMVKMKERDILVSTATTPSIIPAIRKAAAIITDEGGLTCHAAIVSREFEIPCVTGTKFATKVLKDGDRVEVDANQGIINIIR